MADPIRIGFTGDVMLGRLVDQHQRERPVEAVWGNLRDRLGSLDGLFINLECCLSTRGTKWTRTHRPFHFRANPDWAIPALTAVDVDWVAVANNHILDYGPTALRDTLNHLDEAGIAHAGAGQNTAAATAPVIVPIGDLSVATVAFTDNTPEYAAGPDSLGTARIEIDVDNTDTRDTVEDALAQAHSRDPDLVVASLHWGPNMVETPPASFETFGQWLIDQGVDFIHGHSAHIFQGIEVYEGRPILYDTGDFVDDYAVDDDLRNDRSFLFELHIRPDGTLVELRMLPVEIYDFSVHAADKVAADWSRQRMQELSDPYGTRFDRKGEELILELQ